MGKKASVSFLDKSVGHQLGRAYSHFVMSCADHLRPHRITPRQFSLLSLVCRCPSISQSEVRRLTAWNPSLVTSVLESLRERKLIRRESSNGSRRWSPTAEGLRKEEEFQRKVIESEQSMCRESSLSAKDRSELLKLLSRITRQDSGQLPDPEGALPAHELRSAAGSFATGVTVIAVRHERDVHGMTANSFLSVSLKPPLVLFSLTKQAKLRSLLSVGKHIGISILAKGQEDISDHFANRGNVEYNVFAKAGKVPVVKGAHATYHVVLEDIIAAGDHELFICRVERTNRLGGEPLVFHGGIYATISIKGKA